MKNGFTLAEVLVTLGIIGVVAALTTPALIQNVGNAKIGPRLQKAKATWENACEMMLNEQNSNSIMGVSRSFQGLGDTLSNHMKITKIDCYGINKYSSSGSSSHGGHGGHGSSGSYSLTNAACYESDDKMMFAIKGQGNVTDELSRNASTPRSGFSNIPHNQYIGTVVVDINASERPNTLAKDVFLFSLMNDGTLLPYGSQADKARGSGSDWRSHGCTEDNIGYGDLCAGSIFDNGMKIIYE